mmetsp:Transcript_25207/g.71069  ORF Transcript_25207/g.71069 Transcript_25207/m.71069 type:complete len:277 (+) Transcript_25207:614-1444(+)
MAAEIAMAAYGAGRRRRRAPRKRQHCLQRPRPGQQQRLPQCLLLRRIGHVDSPTSNRRTGMPERRLRAGGGHLDQRPIRRARHWCGCCQQAARGGRAALGGAEELLGGAGLRFHPLPRSRQHARQARRVLRQVPDPRQPALDVRPDRGVYGAAELRRPPAGAEHQLGAGAADTAPVRRRPAPAGPPPGEQGWRSRGGRPATIMPWSKYPRDTAGLHGEDPQRGRRQRCPAGSPASAHGPGHWGHRIRGHRISEREVRRRGRGPGALCDRPPARRPR